MSDEMALITYKKHTFYAILVEPLKDFHVVRPVIWKPWMDECVGEVFRSKFFLKVEKRCILQKHKSKIKIIP